MAVTISSVLQTTTCTCTITTASQDADVGDTITYTYEWHRDQGTGFEFFNSIATTDLFVLMESSNTTRGDVWKCVVTPNDDTDDGLTGQDEVTIGNSPPNAPESLRCEGVIDPTGVTDPTPEFSWTFSDPDGDIQGAYQILMASTPGGAANMWDSGKVIGSASEVSYDGTAFAGDTPYYWKVKTWDNDAESTYCDEQQFTTGTTPSEVWVNDGWAGSTHGDIVDSHTFGTDAFATMEDGIDAVASGGIVNVAEGIYSEHITIGKSLTLQPGSVPIIDGGGSGTAVTISAHNVAIIGFTIQNAETGVSVTSGADNVIHWCNIINNATWGLNNTSGNLVTAEHNWWGDVSGPTHAGNPGGAGDAVSDSIDYEPWLLVGVAECASECISGDGCCSGTSTGGDVTIDATGEHTITTVKYTGNPGGSPTFEATGDYYDVHLDDDTVVNSLIIEFCPAALDTVIYYWNESSLSWEACSHQTYEDGCVVVTITDLTSPSLSDLTGLPFAPGTPPSPPPPPSVAVGGETYSINKVNVLAPWIALAVAIIAGASLVLRRRRAHR